MAIEQDYGFDDLPITREGTGIERHLTLAYIIDGFRTHADNVLRLAGRDSRPITTIVAKDADGDSDATEHVIAINSIDLDGAEEIDDPRGWRIPIHTAGNEKKIIVVTAASLILAGASIALTKYRKSKH